MFQKIHSVTEEAEKSSVLKSSASVDTNREAKLDEPGLIDNKVDTPSDYDTDKNVEKHEPADDQDNKYHFKANKNNNLERLY